MLTARVAAAAPLLALPIAGIGLIADLYTSPLPQGTQRQDPQQVYGFSVRAALRITPEARAPERQWDCPGETFS